MRKRERKITQLPLAHPQMMRIWLATQVCALTGNQTRDLSVRRPALNLLSHTSQGRERHFVCLFLKDFIYLFIFRGREREGERVGEKHQCVVASHVPPIGDVACNPGMCPDWESNQRPFGLQVSAQSTEPHWPGLKKTVLKGADIIRTTTKMYDVIKFYTGQSTKLT